MGSGRPPDVTLVMTRAITVASTMDGPPSDARSRWNHRHLGEDVGEPASFLIGLDDRLPRRGRALDVAAGRGRNGLWLAQRGLSVTLADFSEVALEIATGEALRRHLEVTAIRTDLESDGLPEGKWDVIICFHFLHRPLFAQIVEALLPGGWLVCELATIHNLERHDRPPRPFLLRPGELARLTRGLGTIVYAEGWTEEGRHNARFAGRLMDLD